MIDCSKLVNQFIFPGDRGPSIPFGVSGPPVYRCWTVRCGVLRPPAAQAAGGSVTPLPQSMLAFDWKRSMAKAPPFWLITRPGCGGRWGACTDTRCASVPNRQLPVRSGRAGPFNRPLAASISRRCAHSCGKPSPGRRLDASGGQASESLACGGGTLSEDSRKRRPPSALLLEKRGSARSMAMLTYRTNWLRSPFGRRDCCSTGRFPSLQKEGTGSAQRQLPG